MLHTTCFPLQSTLTQPDRQRGADLRHCMTSGRSPLRACFLICKPGKANSPAVLASPVGGWF